MRFYSPRFDYLYQAILLTVVAVALAVGMNMLRPDPLPFVAGYDFELPWGNGKPVASPTPVAEQQSVAEKDYAEEDATGLISFNRASYLQRHEEAVFIDARFAEDYSAGHIPGALSIPLGTFGDEIDAKLASWGKDQRYVLYCSSESCSMSHEMAMSMKYSGYTNILVYSGGMAEWRAFGGEVEVN